jgi:hypothetical protein
MLQPSALRGLLSNSAIKSVSLIMFKQPWASRFELMQCMMFKSRFGFHIYIFSVVLNIYRHLAYSRIQGTIDKLPACRTLSFGLAFIASDPEHSGCHTCRHFFICADINIAHGSTIEVLVIEEDEACRT